MKLYNSDCLDVLKKMPENSIDSIVTDPPYGVSIMDQKWDRQLPVVEIWRECFRVLKPGGYILAFASSRLYHHLAVAMESCGFETQNMLAWLYGNGFPRGENLSVQLDKTHNIKPDDKFRSYLRDAIKRSGYRIKDLEEMCGTVGMFSHYLCKSQSQFPNYKNWKILKKALKLDSTYDAFFEEREKNRLALKSSVGDTRGSRHFKYLKKEFRKHIPQSEESAKWEGWKYGKIALRPSMESIYFGQKPPIRPVSENVSTYGIGALNIGGCKVKGRDGKTRLPANVMHDGSLKVADALGKGVSTLSELPHEPFFYISKPNAKERGQIKHPTLKPLALMRQLVKLVTPKGRTCLDPFMGSGTTGLACSMEGVEFVGIEREREYFEEARGRLGDCVCCKR